MLLPPECTSIIKTAVNGLRLKIVPECEKSFVSEVQLLSFKPNHIPALSQFQTFQRIEQSHETKAGWRQRVHEQGGGNRLLVTSPRDTSQNFVWKNQAGKRGKNGLFSF